MNEYRDVLVVLWTWVHFYANERPRKRNLLTYWISVDATTTLQDLRERADMELTRFRTANNHIVHSQVYCYIDTRSCSNK